MSFKEMDEYGKWHAISVSTSVEECQTTCKIDNA